MGAGLAGTVAGGSPNSAWLKTGLISSGLTTPSARGDDDGQRDDGDLAPVGLEDGARPAGPSRGRSAADPGPRDARRRSCGVDPCGHGSARRDRLFPRNTADVVARLPGGRAWVSSTLARQRAARSKIASIIGSVSLPVNVFCWLGWKHPTSGHRSDLCLRPVAEPRFGWGHGRAPVGPGGLATPRPIPPRERPRAPRSPGGR